MTKTDLPPGKHDTHLTLLHTSHTISGREFRNLSFEKRLELVRRAIGRRKYELLVEAPDAERLIRRLPAQEVYLLIRELGVTDVPDLLFGTNTNQFTAFLDLDCWRGDLFDSQSAMEWLAVLFEGGEEKVLETLREIDFPLLVLLCKKQIEVSATPGDFDDEESRFQVGQQHGGYEIEFRDAETGKVIAAALQILQHHDPGLFRRLLEAVRWEQEAALEEENYEARRIRIADLGIPDPFESLAIYAWSDPAAFDPAACRRSTEPELPAGAAPAFFLANVPAGGLLADVLAAGIDDGTAWDLTWLLNRVIVADRLDIGDAAEVREASGEVFRSLNLALEYLCGTDVEQAARIFAASYLQALFRLGFSLTLERQRRARSLPEASIFPWLDPPYRAFLEALGHKKPRFFLGVENPARAGERPFATLNDLRLADAWLHRLEALARLFATGLPFELPGPATVDLSGCQPEDPADLTLSTFFLTALANRVLGRDLLPQPIPAMELPALHIRLCQKGQMAELRKDTVQWLETLEPGTGPFADDCLALWEEEFCALPPEAIDLRFLRGLIVRL